MAPAHEVTVEFDREAVMDDGTVLRANVYRPSGEGRWPVLLSRLPYGKDYPLGSSTLDPVQAARRGYCVVLQDTRGRFRSEGDFFPYREEAQDGFDTVAWAAQLEHSSGQVGMYGGSYFGQTQWLAAVRQPPALKAIVPHITFDDNFHGHVFRNGALELGMVASWGLRMAFDGAQRRYVGNPAAIGRQWRLIAAELDLLAKQGYGELPLRGFGPLERASASYNWSEILDHAMDRAYAEPLAISGRHALVQVPAFNIGGWYDCFLQGTLANYSAMRALGRPTKLLIGPWSHGHSTNPVGQLSFGYASQATLIDLRIDFFNLQLRWFDHWLKGEENGVMEEPPVRIFVMGANRWRDEASWPLARAVATAFHLRGAGGLSRGAPAVDEPPDTYDYDPARPVPTRGGNTLLTPEFPAGPYDQRELEGRSDVLVFTSEPLQRDLEVTGPIRLRLFAASSAPDTDWVGRLCDVHPDGCSINLADGILRARYRDFERGEVPSLIEPGRVYEYEVDLWATSNLFQTGHRIRLDISSSSFPRWDRNPNTGAALGQSAEIRAARQTVFHDAARPSALLLPLIQG